MPPPPLAAGAELDWAAVELDYAVSPLAADRIPAIPPAPPAPQPCETIPNWDAIQQDYAANEATIAAICTAHGVTRSRLYRRASNHGWPLRLTQSLAARRRIETEFANRLIAALDLKMTQFHKRIAEATATGSAADSERDARTLSTLVRLVEKLKSLGAPGAETGVRLPTLARSSKAPATSTKKDALDTDKLRNDLAQRLERLRGQIGG